MRPVFRSWNRLGPGINCAYLMSDKMFGVIFDMDGVLADSAEPHFQSWQQLAKEEGQTITRERFQATFGQQSKDVIPALFGETSPRRIQELDDRKEAIYRAMIKDHPPIVPGARELVRDLARAGAKLAVGSSGPMENIELVLEAMEVRELFSVIVSGRDVSRGKPDPQVFSLACERLGMPPECCVVIEDAPVGVDAAKAAGAKAVALLAHHPREKLKNADLIVNELRDLHLEQLRQLVHAN